MDKIKLKDIILKTLEKEGGAAGLKALAKAAKTSKGKLKKDLNKMSGVKQHQDGDYISTPINDSKRSELELWVKKSQKRVNPDIVRREIQKQRRAAQASHSMDQTNPTRIKQLRDKYFDYLDNIDVEDQTMPFPWGLFIPKGLILSPDDLSGPDLSGSIAEVQQVKNKVEESSYRYELNEAQLVGHHYETIIHGPPLYDPPIKTHIVCNYSGNQQIYVNNLPCPEDTSSAFGMSGVVIPGPSSDFKRPDKKLREVKDIIEIMLDEKKKKKKDRCHRKADQVYGTKTSAYKSGAIVKCRKGMIWKKK